MIMVDVKDYDCEFANQWCPGCGNFGILDGMKKAFAALAIPPEELLVVSGIGQAAKTPHFLKCNFFHTLHGRALPVATGAKIANHELTIVVNTGDGDCYGEGGNHLMHAIRRNVDLTVLVHNNRVYGLTKGQASPTSDFGMKTKTQPEGVISVPVNPMALVLSLGAGFVARAFSGDADHLSGLIQAGMRHRGIAVIDILQPCVSFNRVNTFKWYKERVEDLEETGHDPADFNAALKLAFSGEEKIPVGIYYRKEKPHFTGQIPALAAGPLIDAARP
jgi:2-oxoglutarate ferredoxin oxidoreductase subunit beta